MQERLNADRVKGKSFGFDCELLGWEPQSVPMRLSFYTYSFTDRQNLSIEVPSTHREDRIRRHR